MMMLLKIVEKQRNKTGVSDDYTNTMGPVIDRKSLRITNYLEIGAKEGRSSMVVE